MAIKERLQTSQAEKPSLRQRLKNILGTRGMRAAEVKPPIVALDNLAIAIAHAENDSDVDTVEMVYELDKYAEQVQSTLDEESKLTNRREITHTDFLRVARAWDAARSVGIDDEAYSSVDELMEDAVRRTGALAAAATFNSAHLRAKRNGTSFDNELDAVNLEMRGKERELEKVG